MDAEEIVQRIMTWARNEELPENSVIEMSKNDIEQYANEKVKETLADLYYWMDDKEDLTLTDVFEALINKNKELNNNETL